MFTKVPIRLNGRTYPVGTVVKVDETLSVPPFKMHCTFPDGAKAMLKRGTEVDIDVDMIGGFFPIHV